MKTGLAILLLVGVCVAQQPSNATPAPANPQPTNTPAQTVTIPAGTRTLLVLLSPLSSKNAQAGHGVYLQTAVPISADNRTVVPPGSYINGVIQTAKRPGRIKGRAQLQIHFTSITFPSGYSEAFPATVGSAPANEDAKVNPEGRIEQNPQKGRDAGTIIGTTAGGATIGGLADGGARGAGIGAGVGAAVGLATILLTRGDELRLNVGDPIEMVLDRPLTLTHSETDSKGFEYVPRPTRANRDDYPRVGYPVGYPGPVYPPVIYTPNWPR